MALSQDELSTIKSLKSKLELHDQPNIVKQAYYEGRDRVKDLGISIPPRLKTVEAVVGWPGTAVDVLEERLNLEGISGPETLALSSIFRSNKLAVESSLAHLDALIFGVGFICVGAGAGDSEPTPLVTLESPLRMTADYDPRTRRLRSALALNRDPESNRVLSGTLYGLQGNVYFTVARNGVYVVDGRDDHRLGRVTVARLINRPRSSSVNGRSEITRAVRSLTDSAMRTLLGAEIAREFYSTPQRYALGASESAFKDADGNDLNPWSVIQGKMLNLPLNMEDAGTDGKGVMPQLGQFSANSPAPFFDQVRFYAQLFSAETAIPADQLGFTHDNPASGDGIRAAETRLIKRGERRIKQFDSGWVEAAELGWLIREKQSVLPAEFEQVHGIWGNPATPTEAATADAGAKKIAALGLTGDDELAWDLVGLTEAQKELARAGATKRRTQTMTANLGVAAATALQNQQVAQLAVERGSGAA